MRCVIKSVSPSTARATFLLFALIFTTLHSSPLKAVDCASDHIELNSQARVDSFQSDFGGGEICDTVPGTLRIGGPDVVDLTPLSALTTVRDQFQIRGTNNLTSLDGLYALTSVGDDHTGAADSFYIFDNAVLTNFIGLSSLASIAGTLYISDNPVLTSLDGMTSLTSVHALEIGSNDSLTDLSGISALVSGSVSGSLRISGNVALTNLDDLSALTSVGGDLSITHNYALTNLDGLSALTTVGGSFDVRGNTALINLDGLSSLTSQGWYGYFQIIANASLADLDGLSALASTGVFNIHDNATLTNLNGLSALTSARSLAISNNPALTNLNGLSALNKVDWSLVIGSNTALTNLDGLSALASVGTSLDISNNAALSNLNGLSALTSVGSEPGAIWDVVINNNGALTNLDGLSALRAAPSLILNDNSSLDDCLGIVMLVDPIDDYDPGPGPGSSGIPDVLDQVSIMNNLDRCNSVSEILAEVPLLVINAGLNDAWFNPDTGGQGFFITVFPEIKQMFMAWFTYDTERPPEDVATILGEPGHRWLTAQGEYQGNAAVLDVYVTSGGIFDSAQPAPSTKQEGQITVEFNTCNSGTVTYDIPSIDRQGIVPIERVALDNVSLCYLLDNQPVPDETSESD